MSSDLKALITVALSVRQMNPIINPDGPPDNTCAVTHTHTHTYIYN